MSTFDSLYVLAIATAAWCWLSAYSQARAYSRRRGGK